MFSQLSFFLISFTSWKCDLRNGAISSRWFERESIRLFRSLPTARREFRMKRVIVEQHYSSISTKKNRSIRQKLSETSKMYFSYSIEQFTTLKNFYSFLINTERIETKQFVSTINVLKLWRSRRKLLRIWFEIKIFTRLGHAIIIINCSCLKRS